MISLNYAKKIGDKYILNFYADTEEDITKFDPAEAFMFYGAPSVGSIITCTSKNNDTNYYLNKDGVFVKINGDQPVPTELIAFVAYQKISGIKFDTSTASENLLNSTLDGLMHKAYTGVDNNGDISVDEETISYFDNEGAWNGTLVGINNFGTMRPIQLTDVVTSLMFNVSMTQEQVVAILENLTYSYETCDLLNDGLVRAYKKSDGKGGYDYFITVSDENDDDFGFVCVFATNNIFEYSDKEDPIDIGKTGWIDGYVVDISNVDGYIFYDCNQGNLGASAYFDSDLNKNVYIVYYSAGDSDIIPIYSSEEIQGMAVQGWQNLDGNNILHLEYNQIVASISDPHKFGLYLSELNGSIAGAVLIDAPLYNVQFNITNGNVYTPFNNTQILGGGQLCFELDPDSGYASPTQINLTNALATEIDNKGEGYLYNPTGDVTFAATCQPLYTIQVNVQNGSYSGESTIVADTGTATIYIVPDPGYILPQNPTSVTNASYSYDDSKGTIILTNATGDVVIDVACPAQQQALTPFDTNDVVTQVKFDVSLGTDSVNGILGNYIAEMPSTSTSIDVVNGSLGAIVNINYSNSEWEIVVNNSVVWSNSGAWDKDVASAGGVVTLTNQDTVTSLATYYGDDPNGGNGVIWGK